MRHVGHHQTPFDDLNILEKIDPLVIALAARQPPPSPPPPPAAHSRGLRRCCRRRSSRRFLLWGKPGQDSVEVGSATLRASATERVRNVGLLQQVFQPRP